MVGMPHMITKGPELSVLDHHYSLKGGGKERIRILNHLEIGGRVSRDQTLATANLDGLEDLGLAGTGEERQKRFDASWFGYKHENDADVDGTKQSKDNGKPTGWWRSWHGDAEGICREALIRAIRLSLGMSEDVGKGGFADVEDVVNDPPINISFRWACGAPTFEAYIEWDTGPGDPHVIVTFSTPPNGEQIWLNFHAGDPAVLALGYDFDTKDPKGSKGVWLVAHQETYKIVTQGVLSTPVDGKLNLTLPTTLFSGSDGVNFSPIVTVDIPEGRGGFAAPPRTWKK